MKYWQILILALFFSACAQYSEGENAMIPQVEGIKVLEDVSQIALEWGAMNDDLVEGFLIYRDSGEGFKQIANINNPHTTHFVDSGLKPESPYRYFLRAFGKNSYSKQSPIIDAKTSFIDPVESVYASNDYAKKIKLIWAPHRNPSVNGYLIQREIDGRFEGIGEVENRLMVEYFDENLDDGRSYTYRVIALDTNGNPSRPSKIITSTTKNKPQPNKIISITDNLPNRIELAWNPADDIKKYNIYRSETDGNFYLLSSTKGTQYSDEIGLAGKSYFYKISNVDFSNLESELSPSARGSTKLAPAAPTITRGYVDNNEVKLEWSGVTKDYIVIKKQGFFNTKSQVKVSGNSYNDVNTKDGEEYRYVVVAVDENGLQSQPSNEIVLSIK